MFEKLVAEFGLNVQDGCIKYATYENVDVMSSMYNTMYIRKNHVLKKFVGTIEEARMRLGENIKEIKAEKTKKRLYKLRKDFE